MGRKYNTNTDNSNLLYDDNAFQVFLLSLLLVYWVPSALVRVSRIAFRGLKKKTQLDCAKEGWCACRACQSKKEAKELRERSGLPIWDVSFVLISAMLGMVAYRVYNSSMEQETPFDPFAILGVDTSATKRQIQKAYRRLSIVHHPDKNLGDPTAGERFIQLTKAFSALTNEEARRNYEKYGNPDGYIGTTLGLGLPEWVATRQNTVLFLYVISMVLFFPVTVGIWWHRRNKQMTDVVMTDTYMLYRDTLQQSHKFRDMLAAFASSFEFENLYVPEKEVKFCTTSRTSPARDIYNFTKLANEEQRSLLRGFSDEQFDDVMKFCKSRLHYLSLHPDY